MLKTFGKNPSGELLKMIQLSPEYKDNSFQNIESTSIMEKGVSMFKMLKDFFSKPANVKPSYILPSQKNDYKNLSFAKPTIIWFGHSSYLINCNGFNILVDPVFSGNASPFTAFVKAFKGADIVTVNELPAIDVLLLTHDHYDHLDHRTIIKLHPKVKKIVTSLGVGSHLEYWGVDSNKIIQLDWWNETQINSDVKFTATPARHFSGRSLNRGKTLWSSFVLDIFGYRLFLGGDSGYDKQFKIIAEKFGGFDLALLETGQYNRNWPHIHMFPEQTVQAAIDLKAKVLLPVHWSKFALAFHPWNEPPKRTIAAAEKTGLQTVIPLIGQPYTLGELFDQQNWWEKE